MSVCRLTQPLEEHGGSPHIGGVEQQKKSAGSSVRWVWEEWLHTPPAESRMEGFLLQKKRHREEEEEEEECG